MLDDFVTANFEVMPVASNMLPSPLAATPRSPSVPVRAARRTGPGRVCLPERLGAFVIGLHLSDKRSPAAAYTALQKPVRTTAPATARAQLAISGRPTCV